VNNATAKVFPAPDYVNSTQEVMPGAGSQPVTDFGPEGGPEVILSRQLGLDRYDVLNAAGPGEVTLDAYAPVTVHSVIGARLRLSFSLIYPPQSVFYILGNPDQAVAWSTDW